MFLRLSRTIAALLDRLRRGGGPGNQAAQVDEQDALREIEFQPIGPDSITSKAERFLCPVTRQELRPGERIYQCHACRMAYSEAGWEFLKQTNRGKCCSCGLRKTVVPIQGKELDGPR